MRSVFIGRATERAVLEEALRQATRGTPRLVLIEGHAGSGKTSLLRAFADSASYTDPLWVFGDETEQDLPYGLMTQVFAHLDRKENSDISPAESPFTVGANLLRRLDRRKGSEPFVLIIDDVHLTD